MRIEKIIVNGLGPFSKEQVVNANRRYLEDYNRQVTRPFGVQAPNFADYLAEEFDSQFLRELGISSVIK